MKLDKLQLLKDEFSKEMVEHNVSCSIYYYHEGQWHELDSPPLSPSIIIALDKSVKSETSFHSSRSYTAHFYLTSYNAVASLRFPKIPKADIQKKFRVLVDRIQANTLNAYKVSHHHLTNLLSKDAFRDRLKLLLHEINRGTIENIDAQESEQPNLVAVLAFDIDHFKQINDTWGHLYGDQVLKIFGRRLDHYASELRISNPDVIVEIGHPSGEEFLVCISTNANRDQIAEWADNFRLSICEQVLPTDAEWLGLSRSDDISVITPPQLPERRVSTSVGLALHTNLPKLGANNDTSATMLDLADTALYRAKAAGRNQVIFYDEILSSCGRILEHDTRRGVIAIDIGTNVGAANGQEFKVFHPTFTGKTKFSVNDGRTTRTLGLYPKVESGRIVIFDAQAEISFAFVEASSAPDQVLEVGSHLEAIPAGSIGHLLSTTSRYVTSDPHYFGNSDLQTLQVEINSLSEQNLSPFAIVVRFTEEADFQKRFGTHALNKSLAKLYRAAQTAFPNPSKIAVLDSGSICIVGSEKYYREEYLTDYIHEVNHELPALGIISGVCCKADFDELNIQQGSEIDAIHAIELARFSASNADKSEDLRICHFTLSVAANLLRAQLKKRSYLSAYADFKKLIEIGVISAAVYNLGGNIAIQLGNYLEALEHYQVAVLKNPSNNTYKTNLGTVALKLENIDEGLKLLNTLTIRDLSKQLKVHPWGYFCYAALLAQARIFGSPLYIESRFLLVAEAALNIPSSLTSSKYANTIKAELEKITQPLTT